MTTTKHGTASAYFNGCSCQPCTQAGAKARAEGNHEAYRAGKTRKPPLFVEGDRTTPFDEEDQRHGTVSAYSMGCRCAWCRAAGKAYRDSRKSGKPLPKDWNARYAQA